MTGRIHEGQSFFVHRSENNLLVFFQVRIGESQRSGIVLHGREDQIPVLLQRVMGIIQILAKVLYGREDDLLLFNMLELICCIPLRALRRYDIQAVIISGSS